MRIRTVEGTHLAAVTFGRSASAIDDLTVEDVSIAFDACGEITAIDVGDTRRFGSPFDEAAAERAVAWARKQLAAHAAS